MEKIQFMNGKKVREINVYIQAQDSENPLFQCWLTLEQDVDCDTIISAKIKYIYGEKGSCIYTNYGLDFFWHILNFRLQKPGDILQGDCNSYAAAVAEFVIGGILGDSMIYDGDCTVMRVLK